MAPEPVDTNNMDKVSEPQSSTIKRAAKKIYIPIRIQTNALNNDDIAINAAYISIEDLTVGRKKKKSRDVEIRYLDSIRSFRDKIKSSYSCSQDHCPMIKERLDQHQMEHHQSGSDYTSHHHLNCCSRDRHSQTKLPMDLSKVSKGSVPRVVSQEPRCKKSVAISPAPSILKRTPTQRCTENQSMQTSPKCVDFNHTTQISFDSNLHRSDGQNQRLYFRQTQVDQETDIHSFTREDLQEEIQKWFDDIPTYPSLTSSLKKVKKNVINEFVNKIFDLSNGFGSAEYERNVKIEIDNFLNTLPMWYPGAKRDQNILKEGIKNNLLSKIKSLSSKSLNRTQVKYVDDMVNTDVNINSNNNGNFNKIEQDKEKIIESEVLDWLMQIKFKECDEIGRTINIIDATDIFTKRLIPLLDKPTYNKNYKLILKGLIVDTLNDLPNVLHYPKQKRSYLNHIAEDLTNRLICIQSKHKKCFDCSFSRQSSMYQLAVCSKSSLKQSILDGLNDCLQNSSIEKCYDIKEEITDILIDCLESVRFKEDIEYKDDLINNVIGNRYFEMSETQTSDMTLENIRDILTEDIINREYPDNNLLPSCQSGVLSIFTSEHCLSGAHTANSTPKQKTSINQEMVRLNKEEISYMGRVSLLIKKWMETLPKKFDGHDEKGFKNVIIKDLADDIMDQLKLEQLAPNTKPDRDKFIFYIIFRWLFRFEIYEDLNDATPQIENLVLRLHDIPVPILNKPQRVNRQAMANINNIRGDLGQEEEFVPQTSDALEDIISFWMRQQPSQIFTIQDKSQQNKLVHELVGTVKYKIDVKEQEEDLDNDISKWLKIMLKSSEKNNIDKLRNDLKSRIIKLRKDSNQQFQQSLVTSLSKLSIGSNNAIKENVDKVSDSDDASNIGDINSSCKCPQELKGNETLKSKLSQEAVFSADLQKENREKRTMPELSIAKVVPGAEASGFELSQNAKSLKNSPKDEHKKEIVAAMGTTSQSNKSLDSSSSDFDKIMQNQMKKSLSNAFTSSKDAKSSRSDSSQSTTTKKKTKKMKSNNVSKKRRSSDCECPKANILKTTEKKQPTNKGVRKSTVSICQPSTKGSSEDVTSSTTEKEPDSDKTLTGYIEKYMDRNNGVDDNLTKGAFGEILKREFRKLDPPTRKEVYDSYSKENSRKESSPERFGKELEHIKDISDWLKNIPIDGSFNTSQNKDRIEFVNNLAMNIYEIEDSRRNEPSAKDYNSYLASIITQYTQKLPILPEHTEHVPLMVDQLYSKVIAGRTPMPCCKNQNLTTSSLNSTSIPEQNISEFIDDFIRLNAGEIASDPVKLDAWSARVLKEAKKIVRDSAEPSTLCKTQVYNKLTNIPIPEEDSIRLFGLELDYAKEISEWLNNLPLQPVTTSQASDQRVKMISELAEKFAEKEKSKIVNPNETQSNEEIEAYVTKWIHELPLDSNKDITMPLVIYQLLNRIEKVNSGTQEESRITTIDQSTNTPKKVKSKGKAKISKCRPCCSSGGKAGQLVVEAIETWSQNLPVKTSNKNEEKDIKDGVARKLFQKVGDLSMDPHAMSDDLLYQELLTYEIDQQLNQLPQSPDIQKRKENLKKNLIDKILEAKNLAEETTAGENYKQKLETTIDASVPNPKKYRSVHDHGFEIYKSRVAEMFILENFDHGNDEVKLKYERMIKEEINKHCHDAQMQNAIPLSVEQIYNELYGALYKVAMPCESSTAEEVEEVKTRCEVADWFESLPLQQASSGDELLKRDRIQSMLAKRLKEIEKKGQKPDEKMHNEITKWLLKLPLQSGNEDKIDTLADTLQDKLKSTKEHRKRVPPTKPSLSKKSSKTKGILGTSQVAGPSSAGKNWTTPLPPNQVCSPPTTPRKKAAEIILEIVEDWCKSLPFYENTQKSQEINKIIRDDLGTKIIIKICEMNGDPKTFSDDLLYDYLLDDELEKLMASLPICCDFIPTKNYKKTQLKQAINSVKPLIKEERARHEYKKDLNATVNDFLKEPIDSTADKIAEFNQLREEIVDDFVQYHYNRDDEEGKQIYKAKLKDAVMRYFLEMQDKSDEPGVDLLMKQNQLLCELSKISIPSERAIKDEVEEIRMKNEVKQFFEDQALNNGPEEKFETVNNIKTSLAKRLNEIEKTGHNCTNDAKMKKEISRYLNKIDINVNAKDIEAFVDNLKVTEAARKAPPVSKYVSKCSWPKDLNESQAQENYPYQNAPYNAQGVAMGSRSLPAGSKLCCPQTYNDPRSLGVTPGEYQGFGGGVGLSSSPRTSSNGRKQDTANFYSSRIQNIPGSQGQAERFEANKRKIQIGTSDNERTDEECKCKAGKERKKGKGRPRCVLRRSQFCDDCDEYGPMWMPVPPPFRCPPGYFYF